LNSTLKCNSMTSCEKSGAAVGSVLFPPSKMRSTNETLQSAHAGTKIYFLSKILACKVVNPRHEKTQQSSKEKIWV